MKKMIHQITDSYNAVLGTVIAVLSMLFGEHWYLFALFFLLNIADWITGWMKSRMLKKENSVEGLKGIIKKLGYWLMVLVAFMVSAGFIEIGSVLGIDLGITSLLGWFVLASLTVNEIRSVCENFVEAGFEVPMILIKGLEVANQMINSNTKEEQHEAISDKQTESH